MGPGSEYWESERTGKKGKKLHRYVHCRLRLFFHFANLGRRIVEMAKKRQATPQYARGPRPFHSHITLLLCIIYEDN